MTRRYSPLHCRAVTLTELLVVLLIVSLLATIALPVYLTKAQQAKIVAAKQETRELAHAEEHCALLHGFYVPLQMLDDLIYDSNISRSTDPRTDDLFNENQRLFLIDPFKIVEHSTGAETQPRLSDRDALSTSTYHAQVERMYLSWGGPFINFQRDFVQQQVRAGVDNMEESRDFPLDPWGQPYRFYTPMGLAGINGTSLDPTVWDTDLFSNGQLDYSGRDGTDRFDRFAVVSFGPDRDSDPLGSGETSGQTGSERDDDIFYLFSGFFNESSFRVFY